MRLVLLTLLALVGFACTADAQVIVTGRRSVVVSNGATVVGGRAAVVVSEPRHRVVVAPVVVPAQTVVVRSVVVPAQTVVVRSVVVPQYFVEPSVAVEAGCVRSVRRFVVVD